MTPQKLFDDFWAWRLERTPEFASLAGSKDYNSKLETFTLERFSEDLETCKEFSSKCADLLSKERTEVERLNLCLLKAELDTFIAGHEFKGFMFPINYMEGLHADFERLAGWVSPTQAKDFEDIIERLRAFETQADQVVGVMQAAVKEGRTLHRVSLNGVLDVLNGHITQKPEDTSFYEPFKKLPDSIPKVDQDRLSAAAVKAIKSSVQPGMAKIRDYLSNEYSKHTRPEIAATSLPDGTRFYQQCIKYHTNTECTPEQIHKMGLIEVVRIETAMKQIVRSLGHDMSLKDFNDKIRNDKDQYFGTEQEVIDAFKDIVENKVMPNLTKIFHNLPKHKMEVVPSETRSGPAAYYINGTADGSRPGKFFVNRNFKAQPKYDMMTLALHEGNPGHHLQASFLLAQGEDVPEFRKVMEDRSYFQCPSRFPINTAYCEGWGLYAESLGFDLGLYDDPYDRYGHLSAEIFRAARLVVDTGIHALGWTREQAVSYMMEHSASSRGHTEQEVDRYITWPGQALGYKMGQIRIRQMRQEAEEKMGDSFDIRAFHEVVLKSSGPMEVLQEEVSKYIAGKK